MLIVAVSALATFPLSSAAQTQPQQQKAEPPAQPQLQKAEPPTPLQVMERDLAATKKALLNESTDLEAMAHSFSTTEVTTAARIAEKASLGVMEVDATLWFLGVYENMQCEPDREVAKATLKNRLDFYSNLLGIEGDQVTPYIGLAQSPATAQSGQRIREDLRTAKSKLDEIASSLK